MKKITKYKDTTMAGNQKANEAIITPLTYKRNSRHNRLHTLNEVKDTTYRDKNHIFKYNYTNFRK